MKSRPLDACPGAGKTAAGTISAGYVMRGSDPLGERIGGGGSGPSSGGWVAFRSPAGSPRLERMYYDFASPSRLFRTNFLISFAGIAGTGKACRSHSPSEIAKIVPTKRKNRSCQEERSSNTRVRCFIKSYVQAHSSDCESCRIGTFGSECLARVWHRAQLKLEKRERGFLENRACWLFATRCPPVACPLACTLQAEDSTSRPRYSTRDH
jgi:hypothetical protein